VHVIGRLKGAPQAHRPANLILHGEQTYDTTVAHIRHADIGLALYRDVPGVEYQTAQSNRILLYRHFGLPIIGPARLCDPGVPSIIGYDPQDPVSIRKAAERAEAMPPLPADPGIPDWHMLYDRITATRRISTG
jgi:2-beta-glucuronyltransferase